MVIYILSDVGGARYDLSYQWYYSDGNEWIIIPDATDSIYSFILNEDNAYYRWKLIVKENVPIIIEENNIKEKENLPLIENSDIVNIELIEECEIIEE